MSIVQGGDQQITGEFESWALNSGKQIMFVSNRMVKVLQSHYMMGSYQDQASYGYSYAEMCKIMEEYLGPSDKARVRILQQPLPTVKPNGMDYQDWVYVMLRVARFVGVILWGTVKCVAFIAVVPFAIWWVIRGKK